MTKPIAYLRWPRNLNGKHTRRRTTNKAASVGGLFHIDSAMRYRARPASDYLEAKPAWLLNRGELRRLAAAIHCLKLVYVFLGFL
jgi:hypothetical protein